tara:strand:+ start:174 stop:743 length:570 start_codon:yes stop_codon:yes gene_type:complete
MKQRCDLRVIDNFFSQEDFKKITNIFENPMCPWYLSRGITNEDSTVELSNDTSALDNYMFCHMLYEPYADGIASYAPSVHFSELISIITAPMKKVLGTELNVITRIKCNMYPRTNIVNRHPWHTDSNTQPALRGALLMLNTCDGYTGFIDGTKVGSVANRMAIFDANEKHHSTSTSDASVRLTLNINYV